MEILKFGGDKPKAEKQTQIGPASCGGCSSCFSGTMGKKFEQFSPVVQEKFEQIRATLEKISKTYPANRSVALAQRDSLDEHIIAIVRQLPESQHDAFSSAFFEMVRAHTANREIYDFVNGE